MNKLAVILLLAISLFACHPPAKVASKTADNGSVRYTVQKKIICSNGAVASAHTLASRIGVVILRKGGNAIDVAITTQLALVLVYPVSVNIGGVVFMVARLANGKMLALDYREKASMKASRDMYLDAS